MNDPLGLLNDPELQLTTLEAGWTFYQRVKGTEEAQQALKEWVAAYKAIRAIGIADLTSLRERLDEAFTDAESLELRREILACIAPPFNAFESMLKRWKENLPGFGPRREFFKVQELPPVGGAVLFYYAPDDEEKA